MHDDKKLFDRDLVLANSSICLRPITKTDINKIAKIAFDSSIWTHFVYNVTDENDLKTYFDDMLLQHKLKLRYTFVGENVKTQEIIGITALGNYSEADQRIEIGWTWIARQFRGSEASQSTVFLLLHFLFDHIGLIRVEFKTDVLNRRARNRLLKLGCTEEGILRSHTLMPGGRRRDTIFYSILSHEWPDIRSRFFSNYSDLIFKL